MSMMRLFYNHVNNNIKLCKHGCLPTKKICTVSIFTLWVYIVLNNVKHFL